MSAQGRLQRRVRTWLGGRWVYAVLAVLVYIPPLLTKRGIVSADNKVYLYLDPARMLSDSPYLWDPNVFAGTVPHQGVGYLFPVAPYYWLIHTLNIPVWIGQRIWLSTVMFFAGAGVVYLLRTMRWRGPGVLVASLAYMFTPYFLNYASAFTVIALPWTGLPWLLAFVMLSVRHRNWRYPALYAITIQLTGSVNASSLSFEILASLLWLPFTVWISREITFKQACQVVARIGILTFFTSLWWMSGLWAQSRYGINVLAYSETARTVAEASSPVEILRGLGYWYFYGTDKLMPIVDSGAYYTGWLWLLGLSFVVPATCLLAGGFVRFKERAYFAMLIVVGMVFAVGAYPWKNPSVVGGAFKWFLSSSQAGSAMRSLPRAAPLIILGLAVMLGAGITALHESTRIRGIPRPLKRIQGLDRRVLGASALVAILLVANQPALFTGWFITRGISRPSEIPEYWHEAAASLNEGSHDSRIWAIPGSNFASYRWDGKLVSSVDPILPGLTSRPFVAREQVPYGTYPTANLLIASDDPLQQNVLQPDAIAPLARFLSVGDLFVRADDLAWVRYGTVRPNQVWDILRNAPGLGTPKSFGGTQPQHASPDFPMLDEATLAMGKVPNVPRLATIPVLNSPGIIKTASAQAPILMAGDGSGLVSAAGAGLLTGNELVLYSGSMANDPKALRSEQPGATLVLTDTNRRRGQRWGTIQDTFGATEASGEKPMSDDPSNQRIDIFADVVKDGGDATRTVADQRGGVTAQATGYGNPVTFTPDTRAFYAVDATPDGKDDLNSAWTTAAFGPTKGQKLKLTFPAGLTSDHVTLVQPQTGRPNRWITQMKLTFDNGFSTILNLGSASKKKAGQTFTFPTQTFKEATLEVMQDSVGHQYIYQSASSVGLANVSFGPDTPRAVEYIRLPEDLLGTLGTSSRANPLAIVLTRDRINRFNALRTDPESTMVRSWKLPTQRAFGIVGTARLSARIFPGVIDRAIGMSDAAHGGVDVTESRHLTGAANQRATVAIDNDPATYWTTGFLPSVKDFAQYSVAKPITFDHFNLQVVSDGRHSVPTRLKVTVDGKSVQVNVPKIARTKTLDSTTTVRIPLGESLTGSKIRFTITKQKSRFTRDWYANTDVSLPVSIAEWGVPGLTAKTPALSDKLSSTCRTDLALIDNKTLPLRIVGTVGDALGGKPLKLQLCGSQLARGLSLSAGKHDLLTAPANSVGFSVDQLVLRSKKNGDADHATGPLVNKEETAGPKVVINNSSRTSFELTVTGASKDFWLVLGQSQSAGWKATVNGHEIGGSRLVDGYANGWKLDASNKPIHISLNWTPQRVVWIAIALSGLAMVITLGLILLPLVRKRPLPIVETPYPAKGSESVPLPFQLRRGLEYPGATPKMGTTVSVTIVSTLVGGALVAWWAAPIFAVLSGVCLRNRKARPLLTLGGPLCMFAVAAYYVAFVAFRDTYLRFGWPSWFTRIAPLGWFAVLALVLDVIIERCWLRRWWPSLESEE